MKTAACQHKIANARRLRVLNSLERSELEALADERLGPGVLLRALKSRIITSWNDETTARLMAILREKLAEREAARAEARTLPSEVV